MITVGLSAARNAQPSIYRGQDAALVSPLSVLFPRRIPEPLQSGYHRFSLVSSD